MPKLKKLAGKKSIFCTKEKNKLIIFIFSPSFLDNSTAFHTFLLQTYFPIIFSFIGK